VLVYVGRSAVCEPAVYFLQDGVVREAACSMSPTTSLAP
jgi:hypothetical protein